MKETVSVPASVSKAVSDAAVADDGRLKISPRARHLAERTDADLSRAVPTGPNGRIIERDVNALLDKGFTNAGKAVEEAKAAEMPAAAPAAAPATAQTASEYTDVKLPNIRKVIAKSMHASLSNMAQLTLNSSFDALRLWHIARFLKQMPRSLV